MRIKIHYLISFISKSHSFSTPPASQNTFPCSDAPNCSPLPHRPGTCVVNHPKPPIFTELHLNVPDHSGLFQHRRVYFLLLQSLYFAEIEIPDQIGSLGRNGFDLRQVTLELPGEFHCHITFIHLSTNASPWFIPLRLRMRWARNSGGQNPVDVVMGWGWAFPVLIIRHDEQRRGKSAQNSEGFWDCGDIF